MNKKITKCTIEKLKRNKEIFNIFSNELKENNYYNFSKNKKNNKINFNNFISLFQFIKNSIKNSLYCVLMNVKMLNEQDNFFSGLLVVFLLIFSFIGFLILLPIILIIIVVFFFIKHSKRTVIRLKKIKATAKEKFEYAKRKIKNKKSDSSNPFMEFKYYLFDFPVFLFNGILMVFFNGSFITLNIFNKILEKLKSGLLNINQLNNFLFNDFTKLFHKNNNNNKFKSILDSLNKEKLKENYKKIQKVKNNKLERTQLKALGQSNLKVKEKDEKSKIQKEQQLKTIDPSKLKEKEKNLPDKNNLNAEKPLTMQTSINEHVDNVLKAYNPSKLNNQYNESAKLDTPNIKNSENNNSNSNTKNENGFDFNYMKNTFGSVGSNGFLKGIVENVVNGIINKEQNIPATDLENKNSDKNLSQDKIKERMEHLTNNLESIYRGDLTGDHIANGKKVAYTERDERVTDLIEEQIFKDIGIKCEINNNGSIKMDNSDITEKDMKKLEDYVKDKGPELVNNARRKEEQEKLSQISNVRSEQNNTYVNNIKREQENVQENHL